MEEALGRLSGMPGQRKMVFISPGFILSTLFSERMDLVDRANRSGVVIDTLDARGLYTPDVNGDIADPPGGSFKTAGFKSSYRISAQFAQAAYWKIWRLAPAEPIFTIVTTLMLLFAKRSP